MSDMTVSAMPVWGIVVVVHYSERYIVHCTANTFVDNFLLRSVTQSALCYLFIVFN